MSSSVPTSFELTGGPPGDVHVRIAELAAARPGDGNLVAVGLGSCVGVAMFEQESGAVALAHVFLPDPGAAGPKPGAGPGTYARTAVPELERRLTSLGARRTRLQAVIAGGAKMFAQARPSSSAGTADVGERNIESVRSALAAAGIELVGDVVGGTSGRTLRIEPGTCRVIVKQVGKPEQVVREGRPVTARGDGHASVAASVSRAPGLRAATTGDPPQRRSAA